jgi:hypothetical protein
MNRSLLLLVALSTFSAVAAAQAHSSSSSAAPRMVAPAPQPAAAIPGLRVAWSIAPGSVHLDSRHTASTLTSSAPIGANGFPAPHVPVNIVLRLHNETASTIDVGDEQWQLTLTGPGAVSLTNRSGCVVAANVQAPRVVHVPAHADAEITLEGLTTGGNCPVTAWFYTAPGHYTVEGTVHARFVVGGGGNIARGTPAVLAVPRLAFEVTR